ncbi:MAG: hypothetical protein IV090_08075 [Candidatus Sericytochromatia bacterium]|nr:hypothetical protein [Candidatus Sericytochromatia bacterium]
MPAAAYLVAVWSLVSCQGLQGASIPAPSVSPSVAETLRPSPQPSATPTEHPSALPSPTPVPNEDAFATLQVKKVEPLFPDGIEGVVPGLQRYANQIAVNEKSPASVYFLEQTQSLVGLKNIPAPITGHILGLNYSPANRDLSYYGGEVYAHNGKCIVKGSTDPQKYPRILTLVAGDCPASNELRVSAESLISPGFTEITALTVAPNGDIYLIDNKKFKRIRNKAVETVFESGPLGGIMKTLEGSDSVGLPVKCPIGMGVCIPGSFLETPQTTNWVQYKWDFDPYGRPKSHSIDFAGEGIQPQSVPVLRDGLKSEASYWNPEKLQVDSAGNIYFSEPFIYETYLRRISPDGKLTTLISLQKDSLLIEPAKRTPISGGLLPAQHILEELPGLLPPPSNCPENKVCAPVKPYFEAFAIDPSRGILYLLGNYLFAINLKTQELKVVRYILKDLMPEGLPLFMINDMDVDADGDVYITFKPNDFHGNERPASPIFQMRLH